MKILKYKFIGTIALLVLFVSSCQDLTEINQNPNQINPEDGHPNLIMPTILSLTAKSYTSDGFQVGAGTMQHTQKDAWSDGHNDHGDVGGWDYGQLRNAKFMYNYSVERGLTFHEGVAMVMRAFIWGRLTDAYGDAPYSDALKAAEGEEYLKPVYDDQRDIYLGILADLEAANTIFSGSDFPEVNPEADLLYGGDAKMWQKFANSLALRYYMRVSDTDLASVAEAGIKRVAGLPLITSADEDATIDFLGTNGDNAWYSNIPFNNNSAYLRYNMCSILTEKLLELGDDRIEVWASKVNTPIVLADDYATLSGDTIVDGNRYISQDTFLERDYKLKVRGVTPSEDDLDNYTIIDTTSTYVGLPQNMGSQPNWYNLNPTIVQGGNNVHVSKLNSMYAETSGSLLKMRFISAAEVHFLLSEAASKGWIGNQQSHYEAGVAASFDTWGVDIGDYLTTAAAYDGTLEQLMEQKWIASWTSATEAWMDWRRTGLPDLQVGPRLGVDNLPLRNRYPDDEANLNGFNYHDAVQGLVPTDDVHDEGPDSKYSKMWLLQ